MIAYIEGTVIAIDDGSVILKTSMGIAYEVYYHHPITIGGKLSVFTCLIIRENSQELYGFDDFATKQFFDLLLTVKGVGPKSAYGLLSSLGSEQITNAIILDNKKMLSSAPGIGPKASSQIILDLRDKIGKIPKIKSSKNISKTTDHDLLNQNTNVTLVRESLAACNDLGFREEEVISKINTIIASGVVETSEIIKQVLQRMG